MSQNLFDTGWESSGFGLFGTRDAAPTAFSGWLLQLMAVARETQRIRKRESVYSFARGFDRPDVLDINPATMKVIFEQLDVQFSAFVVHLGIRSEGLNHGSKRVALHYGDAPQVILEFPNAGVRAVRSETSDWVSAGVAKLEIEKFERVEEIAEIIGLIETRLQEKEYHDVSQLFGIVDPRKTPVAFLVAALRITSPCRSLIENWQTLCVRTKSAIEDEGRDSTKVLRGLLD